MRSYLTPRNLAATISGALLAALSLSGTAEAITDTIFKYSNPKVGYLSIPAPAFTPQTDKVEYDDGGLAIHPTTTAEDSCFLAPVNLPSGAKMTRLVTWYRRPADSDEFWVYLTREKLADGTYASIINRGLAFTGGARKFASITITSPALQSVDNLHYTYFIEVCMSGSAASILYAMRLTYTYTNAGD